MSGQVWPAVGDLAFLPRRGIPGPVGDAITGAPGRVVSVTDDWALVDRDEWGQFGCPVADLIPLPSGGVVESVVQG